MMQANELRIGNYYMYAGGNGIVYAKVKCIKFNEFGLLSDYDGVNFGICAPIPITEEWLLKLGFNLKNKRENRYITENGFEINQQGNDFTYCVWGGEDAPHLTQFFGHCQYVHQLQNLYFALTNNELNIQL